MTMLPLKLYEQSMRNIASKRIDRTWNDDWCPTKMLEFTLCHNEQRHLGQSEDWIF